MGRLWSLVFLAVPILGVWSFVWAHDHQHWFPRDVSTHGHTIDHLFNFCMVLTGVVFVATEVVLFAFLWRYYVRTNKDAVKFTHGSHNLEVVWTIVPAATLFFIAVYQMNAWAEVKIERPPVASLVEVNARQFEWRLRYPGPDGKYDTPDDIHHVNDLHVPVNTDIVIDLKSMDVLHDLFLPNLRVKQDAVPGMKIPVWFRAKEVGVYDLVCAELCGWGHYKMRGRLTVESKSDFDAWLAKIAEEQKATK